MIVVEPLIEKLLWNKLCGKITCARLFELNYVQADRGQFFFFKKNAVCFKQYSQESVTTFSLFIFPNL